MIDLKLDPSIDVPALAASFARHGRVRIRPFLSDGVADALHAHLRQRTDWRQILNSGDKVFELDRPTRAGMSAEQSAALEEAVRQGGRHGFQYRYEALRLADGDLPPAAGEDMLSRWPRWMSSPAVLELLRSVTGQQDIAFADGQATAYAPGDFLTGHDDEVAGKRRRAAYVMGLTPNWRVEWGGLLLFHGGDGNVEGAMPGFNTLDLFAVPQVHSVSLVTPSAAYRRYAITGWLRAGR